MRIAAFPSYSSRWDQRARLVALIPLAAVLRAWIWIAIPFTRDQNLDWSMYDAAARLLAHGANQEVDYGYDLAGNLTTLSYPGNLTVTRSYDPANQLTSITDWLNNVTHFVYDADGNLTSESFPSSTDTTARLHIQQR